MKTNTFTHKLNCDYQTVSNGEFWKGHPVTELSFSGNQSKVRVNDNVEFYIATELLTPIVGVVV